MGMKCKCGNELGQPRVSPFPVSFYDSKTKEQVHIYFMAGFDQHGRCWFCALPKGVRDDH